MNNRIFCKGGPRANRIHGPSADRPAGDEVGDDWCSADPVIWPSSHGRKFLVQQKAMANNLKNCTRFGGTASCTTTTIAWKFGMAADPCIRLPIEQLDMWAQVWYSATGADKQETRFSWQKKLTSYLSQGELDVACGPAAGTIASLG